MLHFLSFLIRVIRARLGWLSEFRANASHEQGAPNMAENLWLRWVTCVPRAGDVVMASLDHVLQRHCLKN
jgi:hypothetical protein